MRQQSSHTYLWTIRKIIDETPLVRSLILETEVPRPHFTGGQYLTVYQSGLGPHEGKSYSIASSTQEPYVQLTIKKMGNFSTRLCAHLVGDLITTSAPYGFFYPDVEEGRDLVFIAGGIGITPCISSIESLIYQKYTGNIFLFYSNRTLKDTLFQERLDTLTTNYSTLFVQYHITREPDCFPHIPERITSTHVLQTISTPAQSDFFICGSIDFTKNLWKSLLTSGIQSNQIYTEAFF